MTLSPLLTGFNNYHDNFQNLPYSFAFLPTSHEIFTANFFLKYFCHLRVHLLVYCSGLFKSAHILSVGRRKNQSHSKMVLQESMQLFKLRH